MAAAQAWRKSGSSSGWRMLKKDSSEQGCFSAPNVIAQMLIAIFNLSGCVGAPYLLRNRFGQDAKLAFAFLDLAGWSARARQFVL